MAEKKKDTKKAPVIAKKKVPASKPTMNLAYHESSVNYKTLIPLILIIVIAALALLKFGFLDLMEKKTAAYDELSQKQTQLQLVTAKLAGYDELADQYGRYSYGWMTELESSLVDRMEVLSIMETIVDKQAVVEKFAVNNNVLNIVINNLTLEETSTLVNALEAHPLVTSATVYQATAPDESLRAQVSMTIVLEKGAQN